MLTAYDRGTAVGLIVALIYGPVSLLTSLPILLGGAALIAVPYLALKGIEWLLRLFRK